jgi:transposase-like protein
LTATGLNTRTHTERVLIRRHHALQNYNVEAKIPAERWLEVKRALIAIREAATPAAGAQAAQAWLEYYGTDFPAVAKCLSEDLDALLAHLQLPWRLRKFVRTTDLVERSFVEERRRSKTLPRFFTEQSCVKLVFGQVDSGGGALAAHRADAARVRAAAGVVSGARPGAGHTAESQVA